MTLKHKKGTAPKKPKINVTVANLLIIRFSFLVVIDARNFLSSGTPQLGQYEASLGKLAPHLVQTDMYPNLANKELVLPRNNIFDYFTVFVRIEQNTAQNETAQKKKKTKFLSRNPFVFNKALE